MASKSLFSSSKEKRTFGIATAVVAVIGTIATVIAVASKNKKKREMGKK